MKESVRIFRFIVIGTMNALIMALVVWLMMREMSFEGDYMVANVTAYIIAQIHNFIWCKYWIFPVEKRKNNVWKQILFFCSAFGVAMNIWPSSLDCLFTELPTLLLIRRLLSNKKRI